MFFLYPKVLILLLLLLVLAFLISTNKDMMQRYFDKDILNKLMANGGGFTKMTRNILLFFVLILFVFALARPVMDQKEQKVQQELIPIVIALDVSKSMNATDIFPSRLELAKKKLKQIVNKANNSMIGVVLFAKNSFILSPVTEDFTSLNYIVDNIDTSLNFPNGSNVYGVLEATAQMLKNFQAKNLIILSDGGNGEDYSNEVEFAKANNIAVYSIGLGTKSGAPIKTKDGYLTDKDGKIVNVALNDNIKTLAINSGGGYIDFSLSTSDIDAIISQIENKSSKEKFENKKVKIYTELFYYPLSLAIFILFIAINGKPNIKKLKTMILNKHLKSLIVMVGFLYSYNLYAFEFDFKNIDKANNAYKNKDYKTAINEFEKVKKSPEKYYDLANSYYKNKDYKNAIRTYNHIITNDKELEYKKLHNLGNSYVKSNDLQKAKKMYEDALKIKQDKQTQENLDMVNKALKQQQQKQQNQNQQNNKDNKDNQDKKNDEKKDKQNQQNQQNKKDSKEKNKDQKDKQNQNKDDKQKQNQQDKNKQQEQNKLKDKTKDKSQQQQTKVNQEIKQVPISDMEEKKWMKSLQQQKAPILLQRAKSSNPNEQNIDQPW